MGVWEFVGNFVLLYSLFFPVAAPENPALSPANPFLTTNFSPFFSKNEAPHSHAKVQATILLTAFFEFSRRVVVVDPEKSWSNVYCLGISRKNRRSHNPEVMWFKSLPRNRKRKQTLVVCFFFDYGKV